VGYPSHARKRIADSIVMTQQNDQDVQLTGTDVERRSVLVKRIGERCPAVIGLDVANATGHRQPEDREPAAATATAIVSIEFAGFAKNSRARPAIKAHPEHQRISRSGI
jgi:hypothetical protein